MITFKIKTSYVFLYVFDKASSAIVLVIALSYPLIFLNSLRITRFPFFCAHFLSPFIHYQHLYWMKWGAFMNAIMQQLVNHKVNSLTKDELLQLARQYQITLTTDQAQKVITILRSEDY